MKRHHLLLVTLLLANAACMEALPIFLEHLMPGWLAIIVSVTAVLFFGEYVVLFMDRSLSFLFVLEWPTLDSFEYLLLLLLLFLRFRQNKL